MALPSKNVSRFIRAADQRLGDASFLLASGQSARTTGAVYLAGYAVECALKALILSAVPTKAESQVLEGFRGGRAHDFDHLVRWYESVGGSSLPAAVQMDFILVNTWDVAWRYNPGQSDAEDAADFLRAAGRVLAWAKGRL